MTDWVTISSLATAGSTVLLAGATFASVRSANRSARAAERAILASLRPVLVPSRLTDRGEKIIWMDGHHTLVGGGAYAHVAGDVLYLALSLRNVGTGLGVLQGWDPSPRRRLADEPHAAVDRYRPQTRDLYIPAGDLSFWHAAIRADHDDGFADMVAAVRSRQPFGVDLLHTDHEGGGQRTISRFGVHPGERGDGWVATVSKHWNIDRPGPR